MSDYGKNGIIDFTPMWEMMKKKKIKKQFLRDNGIHQNTILKLSKNENVTTEVIANLCYLLKCQPHNIMKYKTADPLKPETPGAPGQGKLEAGNTTPQ